MTAQARIYARLCRERLIAQGMDEQEAEAACADGERARAEALTAAEHQDQTKPS